MFEFAALDEYVFEVNISQAHNSYSSDTVNILLGKRIAESGKMYHQSLLNATHHV